MAQYQGGKTFTLKRYGLGAELTRIVTALTPLARADRPRIFDLTCGSGVVLEHFANTCPGRELIGSDLHPAAIGLLRGLKHGWVGPETMTKEEWLEVKRLATTPDPVCPACSSSSSSSGEPPSRVRVDP